MSYISIVLTARATAFIGTGVMLSAVTRAPQAMDARMITTITPAAT